MRCYLRIDATMVMANLSSRAASKHTGWVPAQDVMLLSPEA